MENLGTDLAIRRFANRVLMIEGIPGEAMMKINNIRDEMLDEITPRPPARTSVLQLITQTRGRI